MSQPFTSIRYPLGVDAALGRLAEETDYVEHVEQLIRQVLLTNPGERVNRPDFGCGVRRMLFAPNSRLTASLAQVTIFEALNRWLGSAIAVSDVAVRAVDERLDIRIAYTLKTRQEKRFLNLEVAP